MADKALVDRIVASKAFGEGSRAWLEALTDDQAKAIIAHGQPEEPEKPSEPEKPAATEPEKPKDEPAVTAAAGAKPQNDDEVLAMLSPERREMLTDMQARYDAEVAQIKRDIVANSRGVFTEADLAGKKRAELEKLAQAVRPVDHSGQGMSAHDTGEPRAKEPTHSPMPAMPLKRTRAA